MNISHPNLETQSRPTSSNLSKSKSQSKSKSKSKSIDSSNHHHQHSINNANFLQQAHHMYNCPTATHNNNNNIASPHKYSMTKSHVLSSNFLYGSNSLNNTINHTYSNYNGDLLIHNKEKEKKNDKSVSQFNNC